MKRIAIILLAGLASAGTQYDELRERVIAFERPHDVFARKLFGCPPAGEISVETCKPVRGEIDYAAYTRAREAAKTLYGLRD